MLSLVVDDDRTVRLLIRAVLQREGFETIEAEGGRQALEIVKSRGDTFDLIITDVQMPEGDGLTFAKSVRAAYPAIPIIVISGLESRPQEFEFLAKPFDWTTLITSIRKSIKPRTQSA